MDRTAHSVWLALSLTAGASTALPAQQLGPGDSSARFPGRRAPGGRGVRPAACTGSGTCLARPSAAPRSVEAMT